MWSWGDGDFGKLGRGGSEGAKVPKMIPHFGDVVKIRCGRQFSVALTGDGKVFTWYVINMSFLFLCVIDTSTVVYSLCTCTWPRKCVCTGCI